MYWFSLQYKHKLQKLKILLRLILFILLTGAGRGRGGNSGRGVSVEGTCPFYRCIDSIFNTSIRFKNENIVLHLICLFYWQDVVGKHSNKKEEMCVDEEGENLVWKVLVHFIDVLIQVWKQEHGAKIEILCFAWFV